MKSAHPMHLVARGLALPLGLLVAFTLLNGCSAPKPDPSETAAPVKGPEMAAPGVEGDENNTVTIEPPAATADGALPEVKAVDTSQLAEIVAATTGKVTVLNVWATWCGPCVHEMPDLVSFYNESDRKKVAFVSLSIDDVAEISGAIPEFQREHKVPFPIYVLNERNDEGLTKALRGEFEGVIPVTYFYDREGNLSETVLGAVTLAEVREKVAALTAQGGTS